MDFHALPRRDLQALCKRNGVRANMTNAAMADALRALPTVDGVEKYVKEQVAVPTPAVKPVAEEEEQGSPLPRGRRVTFRMKGPDESEEEEKDLRLDAKEEKAPDGGVGLRGPSRRTRTAAVVEEEQREKKGSPLPRGRRVTVRSQGPVRPDESEKEEEEAPDAAVERPTRTAAVATPPTTRTRAAAAASKIEAENVAAEAVPAPTSRRRIQGAAPVEAEKMAPRATRTSRRVAARKASKPQEEEEGNPQDAISDVATVHALTVSNEGFADPEEAEEASNPQTEDEPVQEVEEIIVPTPVFDAVCDDTEAVEEATEPQNKELRNSVDELSQEDEVMDTPAPVEKETPVVEECKGESAVQQPHANAQQCAAPLPSQEDYSHSPIMGLVEEEGGAAFQDCAGSGEEPSDEEMNHVIRHAASEEMETVPVDEASHATLTAREEVSFTGDAAHVSEEPRKEEEGVTHAAVSALDIPMHTPISDEVCDGAEDVDEAIEPQNEELRNAVEESSKENEGVAMETPPPVIGVVEECKHKSAAQEPPGSVQQCAPALSCQEDSPILGLVEQEGCATFPDSSERPLDEEADDGSEVEELELVPVNDAPQATLTATGVSYASHEEKEVADSVDLMQHGSGEANSSLFEEMEDETVVHEVLNDTVSGHETVLDFSGKTTRNVEDEVVVSTVEMSQSTVMMLHHGTGEANGSLFEEKVEETVDEVLDDSISGHETVLDFSAKITRNAAEDKVVVSTMEMQQSIVRMDEDAGNEDDLRVEICRAGQQKEMVTVGNVSQVSVIGNEVVGNEKVFSSDMPQEFGGAGDTESMDYMVHENVILDDMVDNVTEAMTSVITNETTVYGSKDVTLGMCSSNTTEDRSNELVAVEEKNEMKVEKQNDKPLVSTKLNLLSLVKLRAKLKETLIARKRKDEKRVALARLDENAC